MAVQNDKLRQLTIILLFFLSPLAQGGSLCSRNYVKLATRSQLSDGPRYVVIVDGYSSSSQLSEPFKRLGYQLIHIQSSADMPKLWGGGFHPDDFDKNLIWDRDFDGSFTKLARELSRYPIAAVVSGAEPGLELADRLTTYLKLPGNEMRLTAARRNKYLMNEQVGKSLPAVKQIKTSRLDTALKWIKNLGAYPVVLKPMESAGGDGVYVCRDEDEVKRAFRIIRDRLNSLHQPNREVLVQEFLQGDEYVFNTVSSNGKHYITDVWRYHKQAVTRPSGGLTYIRSYNELLSPDQMPPKLRSYGLGVVNALGVRYGASHTEIMMTNEGPRLVELNARLMGGGAPQLVEKAGGLNPALLTAQSYVAPDQFRALIMKRRPALQPARTVRLISTQSGTIKRLPYLSLLRKLPSYAGNKILGPGEQVQQTVDIDTSPGLIYLTNSDPDQLERDYRKIREWEAKGFFELK